MNEDFKIGKYAIYNENKKRTKAIATIHALVQVDGELYAILSHIDTIKRVRALPVEKNENGLTVIHLGYGYYLDSNGPVQPKSAKFEVGKSYIDSDYIKSYIVNAKYTDKDSTYIVLNNEFVAEVKNEEADDGGIVEYVRLPNALILASNLFGN